MTTKSTTAGRTARRVSPVGVIAAAGGVALFIFYVQRVGVGEITAGIGRLGWLFLAVVALGGFRFAARGMAWRGCLEGAHRLTPGRAFQAVVAGDTLGNVTLLSLLVSEPGKALFVQDREPVSRTLAALAVENLFYTLSAVLVIAGGALALVLRLQTTESWWLVSVGLVAALIVVIAMTHVLIWRQVRVASVLCELAGRRLAPRLVAQWRERVQRVEDRVYGLYPRAPGRLARLACWELAFHALAMLEIYLVLSLITDIAPTVLDAFVLESTNRFIAVLFKVVPMQIGVDEAGTGAVGGLLGYGAAAGGTLAIVRKARMLVWATVGGAFLVRRGLSVRRVVEAAGAARHGDASRSATSRGAAVVVMARSPEGVRPPKTRLADVLPDARDRRRLHTAFLADVVATCATVDGATVRVAYTEDGGTAGFDRAGVREDQLLPQRGADLGDREHAVFEDLFRDGFSPVVMIGSDMPTLPAERIVAALDRLRASDDRVVLGPADDGGYYLIGLTNPTRSTAVPDLFTDIRWSTRWARADTVAAAERAGLTVELLGDWYDVDDDTGLTRLRAELATAAGAERAPATTRVLRDLPAQG